MSKEPEGRRYTKLYANGWTIEQDDMLTECWGVYRDYDVALWLGRSKKACECRATFLGISRGRNRAMGATGQPGSAGDTGRAA